MKKSFLLFLSILFLSGISQLSKAQGPALGSAGNFVLFTATGAVTNTGTSFITGNVGTNSGAISGFGNVNGVMHTTDGATGAATADLLTAYNIIMNTGNTGTHAPDLTATTFTAGVYDVAGNSVLNGSLTLDAGGNPNAVFIIRISGTFTSGSASNVVLTNGAVACNVFWTVQGLVSLGNLSTMRGTVIANNGAIDLASGVVVDGRILSTTGAITLLNTSAKIPAGCGSVTLTGPLPPPLGAVGCYAIFTTNGPVANAGITNVRGDIGAFMTGPISGFNSLLVNGMIHTVGDPATALAAGDLTIAYDYLNTRPYDIELLYPAQFGNNLVLTPHTYRLNAATALTGTVFLNAEGNPDAVFVIQIKGALTTGTYAKVILTNGAQAKNVYWNVDGAISIADYSEIKGTFIANNGAISLATGVQLEGRILSTTGAVNTNAVTVTSDKVCSVGVVITPAPFDPCSNFAYQVMGDPSDFQQLNLATGVRQTLFSFAGFSVNAMGYNQKDDRIYAIRIKKGTLFPTSLLVIGSDNTYQVLPTTGDNLPGTVTGSSVFIGDVNADGIMFISEGSKLYSINLNPSAGSNYLKVVTLGSLPNSPAIGPDFAFAAGDNVNVYAVNALGNLVELNTTTLAVTVKKASVVPGGSYGAVFFDNANSFYVSENNGQISRILNATSSDPLDIIGSPFSTALPTNNNDGARCPNASVPTIADYGDAPDSYLTLISSGGAAHLGSLFNPVPVYLGAGLTYDADGQPSPNANKDVDDGISTFPALTAVNPSNTYTTYSVDVSTNNGTMADAYLTGWIDWNNDGTFEASEKVTQTIAPNATSVTLTWTNQSLVYVSGRAGTYARFRITSSDAVTTPGGDAPDGEVEDYFIPFYSISGTVYTDANGGTPDGTFPPTGLFAQLVDANNMLVASVPVAADGTYTFPLLNGVFNVQITNVNGTPSTNLPTNYVHVSSTDATPFDGKTLVFSNGADITGVNFGIEQLPESNPVTVMVPNRGSVGTTYVLDNRTYQVGPQGQNMVQFPPLTGTDPEDGNLGAGSSVKIITVPGNAVLNYEGTPVTAGQVINNYDASQLTLTITQNGSSVIAFTFAFIDAAGQEDPTPATYTIQFPSVLPIQLISFTARGDNGDALLDWSTSTEQNSAGFGIEHSSDGNTWNNIGFVKSKSVIGNSNQKLSYTYTDRTITNGTHYYRLKQTDLNGNYVYSDVAKLDNNSSNAAFRVYPNPSSSYIYIEFTGAVKTPIKVIDMNGRVVKSLYSTGTKTRVETSGLARGTYVISIDGNTTKFTVTR